MTRAATRRWVHASTALLVLIPPVTGWFAFRTMMAVVVVLGAGLEAFRLRSPSFSRALTSQVSLFRPRESHRLSGAFWLCVALAGCSWLSPHGATAGILSAALADPAASWLGGYSRSSRGKTWLGSAAALVVTFAVTVGVGLAPHWAVGVGAAAAAAERWSAPLDDNLVVGPVVGLLVFGLMAQS